MFYHLFLLGWAGIGTVVPLEAATFFVAPGGKDTNSGTADRPLGTLNKAVALAVSRNEAAEIVLARGVYPGNIVVGRQDDRLAGPKPPLLIRAAQNQDGSHEEVIFDGGRRIDQAEAVAGQPGVFRFAGRYSYHSRTHMWEADTRIRYMLVADMTAVQRYPASFWYSKSEVFFHTSDGKPPSTHQVGISRDSCGIMVYRPNVTIRGLKFRNFLHWRWSCGVELRAANTAAEDCQACNSIRGFQVMLDSPAIRVARCRTDDCGGGFYSQGTQAVVEDCRFYKIRDAFVVPVYPQDDTAIQFYYPASGGEVRRNLGVGFCNGVFIKCPVSKFIVEHNTLLDGITYGIGCTHWHPQSCFRANIVVGFAQPLLGGKHLSPTNRVDGNCFWGDPQSAVWRQSFQDPSCAGLVKANRIGDPGLAGPARGDYRLAPDSPCKSAGPEGSPCGALGVAGPQDRDVQPPEVRLTLANPARRCSVSPELYCERDPWLGGAPNRIRRSRAWESAAEWLTPESKATIEIVARDAKSKLADMKLKIGSPGWSKPEAFQPAKNVVLPQESPLTLLGLCVSDTAGNWSEPAWLIVRSANQGPQLQGQPSIRTNRHGVVLSLQTDVPCRVQLELGPDTRYGSRVDLASARCRVWLPDPEARPGQLARRRVTSSFTLATPLIKAGATYHYRFVLEDDLGRTTTTPDAVFTVAGDPKRWFVSPQGEDAEDRGSGERPWRSIQYAVDRALPGDRIVLRPGLYPGETHLTHGGLPEAPITIEAEQSDTVVLDGRHELPTCLRLDKAPHVVIKGLELRWFGAPDTFYSTAKAGVSVIDSPGVSILNCRIWNDFWMGWPLGSGIYARQSPGLVADHNVMFAMEQGIHLYFSPRARITHNTILMNLYGAVQFLYSAEGSVNCNNSFCFSGNDQFVVRCRDERELATFESDHNNLGTKLRQPDPGDEFVPSNRFFQHHSSKAVIGLNDQRFNSLKAWQKAYGKDRHSLFRDPRYADPENWDFHLKPDSPNIGAGERGVTIGALSCPLKTN
jgi:hypothetical protein